MNSLSKEAKSLEIKLGEAQAVYKFTRTINLIMCALQIMVASGVSKFECQLQ
jgi:hypothetical protein